MQDPYSTPQNPPRLRKVSDPDWPPPEETEDEFWTTKDEELVNSALIILLEALLAILPKEHQILEPTRVPARFKFHDKWTAVTDGCLRPIRNSDKIHAIFEVKRYRRRDDMYVRQ
jgi:hypothetical protein